MSAGKLGRVTGLVLALATVVGGAGAMGNGMGRETGWLTVQAEGSASEMVIAGLDDAAVQLSGIDWT